jgi:hypothetical protein
MLVKAGCGTHKMKELALAAPAEWWNARHSVALCGSANIISPPLLPAYLLRRCSTTAGAAGAAVNQHHNPAAANQVYSAAFGPTLKLNGRNGNALEI